MATGDKNAGPTGGQVSGKKEADWTREFNTLLNKAFGDLMPKAPRDRYWTHGKRDGLRYAREFAYTTERTRGARHPKIAFYAIERKLVPATREQKRFQKGLIGTWRIVRERPFATRKKAKAYAYRWFLAACPHARLKTYSNGSVYCLSCGTRRQGPTAPAAGTSPAPAIPIPPTEDAEGPRGASSSARSAWPSSSVPRRGTAAPCGTGWAGTCGATIPGSPHGSGASSRTRPSERNVYAPRSPCSSRR